MHPLHSFKCLNDVLHQGSLCHLSPCSQVAWGEGWCNWFVFPVCPPCCCLAFKDSLGSGILLLPGNPQSWVNKKNSVETQFLFQMGFKWVSVARYHMRLAIGRAILPDWLTTCVSIVYCNWLGNLAQLAVDKVHTYKVGTCFGAYPSG